MCYTALDWIHRINKNNFTFDITPWTELFLVHIALLVVKNGLLKIIIKHYLNKILLLGVEWHVETQILQDVADDTEQNRDNNLFSIFNLWTSTCARKCSIIVMRYNLPKLFLKPSAESFGHTVYHTFSRLVNICTVTTNLDNTKHPVTPHEFGNNDLLCHFRYVTHDLALYSYLVLNI